MELITNWNSDDSTVVKGLITYYLSRHAFHCIYIADLNSADQTVCEKLKTNGGGALCNTYLGKLE